MLFILLSCFTIIAQQYDEEDNFQVKLLNNGTSILITAYTGTKEIIDIPQSIQGIPVTAIGDNAFKRGQWTAIGFVGENQLTYVSIPNSVTEIGHGAFSGNLLTSVTFSDNIIRIGQGAFSDNQLVCVSIPPNLTKLENMTFQNNKLTSLTIPDSVTSIDQFVFSGNQLTEIIIGNKVTIIWEGAFWGNKLTNITIPNSIKEIGSRAFWDNELLSITIGANVKIWFEAFDNNFDGFYNDNGRMAGIYIWDGAIWTFFNN